MMRTRAMRQPLKGCHGNHPARKPREENLAIRQDVPLTEEQQLLVVDALEHAAAIVRRYEHAYPSLDFLGEVGLRLVRQIRDFNESQASLKTWSQGHANFACRDVLRLHIPSKARCHRRLARTISLDKVMPSAGDRDRPRSYAESLADDEPSADEGFAAAEASLHLLRGLSEIEQAAVYSTFVDDVTVAAVGEAFGVSESRASQVRATALSFLRAARARDYPEYARSASCR